MEYQEIRGQVIKKLLSIILVILLAVPFSAFALPVFPGAEGDGTDTRAMYGNSGTPSVCVVIDTGAGTNPANLDEIYEFAKKHNLRVIEDAAHAFGTIHNDKLIGSFGDIVCFSFDGIKNITSGEGGAVVTSDPVVAQYIRDARLLGVQKDTEKRYKGARSWEFDVVHQGYRYHMSNIMAAIGRVQLQNFPLFKKARQDLAKKYVE